MSRNFLKSYGQSLLLLSGVIIGAVCGVVAGPAASIVKPVGELFLNLVIVLVVPLVFFSVASSMCSMTSEKIIGKALGWSLVSFLAMAVIAAIITWAVCLFWNPLGKFATILPPGRAESVSLKDAGVTGQTIVNMFTVSDFPALFSRSELLPLIVFSAFFGIAASLVKEKGKAIADFLEGGMTVTMDFMRILMYAAPVCLGCYFADLVGGIGGKIFGGYLNCFLICFAVTAVIFFGVYSLYLSAIGKDKVKGFWNNILETSLTSISTCSSAACIPVGIDAAKNMGVERSIAESVVPLGVNIHKDGSVVAAVLRIVFTIAFFGLSGYTFFDILGIAILTSLVVGAIPVGGMTAEVLLCSILGVDPSFAATLIVISTVVDIPATLLNSTGNVVSAALVDKLCKK